MLECFLSGYRRDALLRIYLSWYRSPVSLFLPRPRPSSIFDPVVLVHFIALPRVVDHALVPLGRRPRAACPSPRRFFYSAYFISLQGLRVFLCSCTLPSFGGCSLSLF